MLLFHNLFLIWHQLKAAVSLFSSSFLSCFFSCGLGSHMANQIRKMIRVKAHLSSYQWLCLAPGSTCHRDAAGLSGSTSTATGAASSLLCYGENLESISHSSGRSLELHIFSCFVLAKIPTCLSHVPALPSASTFSAPGDSTSYTLGTDGAGEGQGPQGPRRGRTEPLLD